MVEVQRLEVVSVSIDELKVFFVLFISHRDDRLCQSLVDNVVAVFYVYGWNIDIKARTVQKVVNRFEFKYVLSLKWIYMGFTVHLQRVC